MTADLFELIEMRDTLLAEEVGKKAELGWFDVEFTMYGCTFLLDGKQYYRLSADEKKIYDYIVDGAKNKVTPSNLFTITESFPVPVGMKDSVTLEVKKCLASQMRKVYPYDFLSYLTELKQKAQEDSAYSFLLGKQQELECCFDNEKLTWYEILTEYIYFCNKISEEHYQSIKEWLAEERKNMEEEIIYKDQYQRTFYGFAYFMNDKLQYIVNARKETVYKKHDALMLEGRCVSPIFSKTYYYTYNVKLPHVRNRFEEELKSYYTIDFMKGLKQQITTNRNIAKADFEKQLKHIEIEYGNEAKKTMMLYGYRWGILY